MDVQKPETGIEKSEMDVQRPGTKIEKPEPIPNNLMKKHF